MLLLAPFGRSAAITWSTGTNSRLPFGVNVNLNVSTVRNAANPVVPKPISANQGLHFNPYFYFYCLKAFCPIIFSILYRAPNHQIVDKRISLNLLFKLSYLNSNYTRTLGYLNQASNNPTRPAAQSFRHIRYPNPQGHVTTGSEEKSGISPRFWFTKRLCHI